jgi:Kef-type K+ transport system membrane component KefB
MNEVYELVLQLAVILFIANLFRAFSLKLKIPPVVSLIVLGILLGPSLINYVDKSHTIEWIAQVGILFLIFEAGMQTNLKRFKEESRKETIPAIGGVILPFIAGFGLSMMYNYSLLSSLVVGVIMTSTSISVSIITLVEINKLNSIEGSCIINSSLMEDILGIMLISVIFGLSADKQQSIFQNSELIIAIAKIFGFFAITFSIGLLFLPVIYMNSKKLNLEGSILSLSVAVIFLYSWFAELSGLAAITGAYFAGIFIGQTDYRQVVNTGVSNIGKSLFTDFFFISIGLSINLSQLSIKPLYVVLFIVLAIIAKFLGSTMGAKVARFDMTRAIRIGIGMIPRGEVALIIATMGFHRGIIDSDVLSTTVLMVIVTSIISPFLLRSSFTRLHKKTF